MKEVLVLIPAYNEEESIGSFLNNLKEAGVYDLADILVINDFSRDKTVRIAHEHHVKVINHVYNLGYGSALQLGYKYAVRKGYRYVIQLDADGQHDACNVFNIYNQLITPMENGKLPDIVIGSRFADGSETFYINGLKRVSIRFFRWMIRKTTGAVIQDPTSGLQGLNRDAFLYYSKYQNFDYMYPDANMIVQMLMLGYRIVEIPSVMHERMAGESMHSGILKPLIYMMVMPLSVLAVYLRLKTKRQRKAHLDKQEEKGNVQAKG